jgi:hypothetical protein
MSSERGECALSIKMNESSLQFDAYLFSSYHPQTNELIRVETNVLSEVEPKQRESS